MLNVLVPANTDLIEWRDARYRTAPPDVREVPRSAVALLGIDRIMQGPKHGQLARSLQSLKWPTARLTELVGVASYVRSAKAPERAAAISAVAGTQALMMPVEPHLAAVAGDPEAEAPRNRILILQLDESLADADYIAAFLNSPAGRQSRSAAADGHGESPGLRSVSAADAWRMADEVLVALPPLAEQREMARAEFALHSAAQRLADARLQLWREPSKRAAITREARRMTPSGELTEWLSTLPFPMAAPLWAFESKGGNVHARHKQMFLCWEAAIEFHAAVLYSGLTQDQTRLVQETAHLASKFADAGLKPERGTLGVWQGIVGRLSKVFRDHLMGTDTDEQARVRATFAEPPPDVLDLLFSTEIVKIFSQVINLRNNWSGHTGATGDDALEDQLDILQSHLQAFRNLTGDAWLGFPLVRAGGSQLTNGVFRHDVDLVVGPNTPFRKDKVHVTSPMEMNGLYLVSRETSRALPLAPFVQLRPVGFGQQSSCYCYNRIQADGVRLVSYHDATAPEIVEQNDALIGMIQALCVNEDDTER